MCNWRDAGCSGEIHRGSFHGVGPIIEATEATAISSIMTASAVQSNPGSVRPARKDRVAVMMSAIAYTPVENATAT